jgi:hypothetical protein
MRRLIVAMLFAILSLPLTATAALGHERRTVGHYQFVVGWLGEPAFAGQLNAIDLTVTDTSINNAPVQGLEQTLKAEIFYAGLTNALPVTFRARFGLPGKYAADVMPTKDGSYTFRIFGTVGTMDLNERFESGPGRFNDVQKVDTLQYPQPVPVGTELTDRIASLQSGVDQLRLLVLAAIVLAIGVPVAMTIINRRVSR